MAEQPRQIVSRLRDRWRWHRTRRGRSWALGRARRAHDLSAVDCEARVTDTLEGPRFISCDPQCWHKETDALLTAEQAKSPAEIVAVLLPIYLALNDELREHPGFINTFIFREEIGWILYEMDSRLGHPGEQGRPLAYDAAVALKEIRELSVVQRLDGRTRLREIGRRFSGLALVICLLLYLGVALLVRKIWVDSASSGEPRKNHEQSQDPSAQETIQ